MKEQSTSASHINSNVEVNTAVEREIAEGHAQNGSFSFLEINKYKFLVHTRITFLSLPIKALQ